jgi:hypothetical protein
LPIPFRQWYACQAQGVQAAQEAVVSHQRPCVCNGPSRLKQLTPLCTDAHVFSAGFQEVYAPCTSLSQDGCILTHRERCLACVPSCQLCQDVHACDSLDVKVALVSPCMRWPWPAGGHRGYTDVTALALCVRMTSVGSVESAYIREGNQAVLALATCAVMEWPLRLCVPPTT